MSTSVHGRYLLQGPAATTRRLLVGFHGYAERAEDQFERLSRLPGVETWALVSVQALHPFYRGRSQEVVASWMTRADRELAIADNVAYVDRVLDDLRASHPAGVVVYAGFSQGVAMAYRAALRGRHRGAGVMAVGGDVPPELGTLAPRSWQHLRVMIGRGVADDWFTQQKMDDDVAWLRPRVASVDPVVVDAGHEWTPAFDEAAARLLAAVASAHPGRP